VAGRWVNGGGLFPDGRRLLTVDNGGVLQIWDIATGQEVQRIEMGKAWVSALALTPDGRHALVGTRNVTLWDLEKGEKVRAFEGHDDDVRHMTLSPDGRSLLTANWDGKVRLWDFASGDLLRVLDSHEEFVFTAVFSPDGRLIASAGGGRREGKDFVPGSDFDIRLWQLPAAAAAAPPAAPSARGTWLAGTGLLLLGLAAAVGVGLWLARRRGRAGAAVRSEPAGPGEAGDEPSRPPVAMPVAITCPGCGKQFKARPALAGKRVKCPQCAQAMLVPGVQAEKPGGRS
jgi:hypothetical protein